MPTSKKRSVKIKTVPLWHVTYCPHSFTGDWSVKKYQTMHAVRSVPLAQAKVICYIMNNDHDAHDLGIRSISRNALVSRHFACRDRA